MGTSKDTEVTTAITDATGTLRTLRLVTRFASVAEFEQAFPQLVDETSLFVVTKRLFPVGDRVRFVIQLQDRQTITMRGEGDIVESPGRLPGSATSVGMRLRLTKLSAKSKLVHRRLLELRREREAVPRRLPPPPPVPRRASSPTPETAGAVIGANPTNGTSPVVRENAVPGPSYTLPANPLGELPDSTLEAFVECVLYEDGQAGALCVDEPADPMTPIPALGSGPVRRPTSEPGAAPGMATAAGSTPGLAVAPVPVPSPPLSPPQPIFMEVPAARVNVTVGVSAQLLTAVLAAGVGLLGGYALFGRAPRGAEVTVTASAPTPVSSSAATPSVSMERAPHADDPLAQEPAAPAAVPAQVAAAGEPVAPADELFVAPAGAEVDQEPVPAPQPPNAEATGCTASVETLPTGARVKLDGRDVGDAPLTSLDVPCGQEVTVTILHPRYRKVERRLTVNPGEPGHVEARLVRPAARLKLVSSPPGAIVTVDGKVIGKAPADTESTAFGIVYVTATLNGYKVWARRVRVTGTEVTIQARLDPVPGAR